MLQDIEETQNFSIYRTEAEALDYVIGIFFEEARPGIYEVDTNERISMFDHLPGGYKAYENLREINKSDLRAIIKQNITMENPEFDLVLIKLQFFPTTDIITE